MPETEILNLIDQKGDISEEVAQKVIENPKLLSVILDGISSPIARIRFRSAKILKIISLKAPEMLYPQFDFFAIIGCGRLKSSPERKRITIAMTNALNPPARGVFAPLSSFSRLRDMLAPIGNPWLIR